MKQTWRQWLWKALVHGKSRKARRRASVRPSLEVLEDRTLPSGVSPFVQAIDRATPLGSAGSRRKRACSDSRSIS
jgi:hypothetical protein